MIFSYPKAPDDFLTFDENGVKRFGRSLASVVNRALTGKINAIGEVTLTANAASTVLTDARLTTGSVVLFDPVTANAATALYNGTTYVLDADRRNGEHTITHSNNAQTDRTFKFLLIG